MNRNRKILEDVLSGKSFKDVAAEHEIGQVTARAAFLRELRRTVPEIYDEGTKAGYSGAYATPALSWCRENKDRILAAPEKPIAVTHKGPGRTKINNAIRMLEALGYTVTHNVGGEARLAAHQPSQTTTAAPQGVASTDQLGARRRSEET